MTDRLVYLIGEPGAGKSTAMRRATAHLERFPREGGRPPRDLLFSRGDLVAVEIGRRRDAFSGTDALGMTVIEQAVPYLAEHEAPLILAEGARLANKRFLSAAVDAGYEVTLLLMENPHAGLWRSERAVRLGTKPQSESWVAGARTRALNLAANPPAGVTVHRGDPAEIGDQLTGYLARAKQ